MTANNIKTTQAKLMKLARAKRETFLHSGTTTPTVTKNTTPKRTAPIDAPHEGKKRTNTLDNVSPTTTLYEIMAKIIMKIYCHHRHSFSLCTCYCVFLCLKIALIFNIVAAAAVPGADYSCMIVTAVCGHSANVTFIQVEVIKN
uniref:Uncharacterized protein n=1 Tax=Glossina palpalis gambiensis TaxID=67801 RepID=A0A1B0BSF8_9MUSC